MGREVEAQSILAEVRPYVDTLRENSKWAYAHLEAKLLILEGDTEGAIDVLEDAIARSELGWAGTPAKSRPIRAGFRLQIPLMQVVFHSPSS